MTQVNETPIGRVMIYGCGGAGINACMHFQQFKQGKQNKGFALMDPVYIDTSLSNYNKAIDFDKEFYLIKGFNGQSKDGAGKLRMENHDEIKESIADILLKHPPGDLNILVSSASGGSGNVISTYLCSELLSRDKNVIVFLIGSTDSGIEIGNSIKSLKSFEGISKKTQKPVVLRYYENNKEYDRHSVNEMIQSDVIRLAALFSRQNDELDNADLKNWLNYTRVVDMDPKLVNLMIVNDQVSGNKAKVLTVASLAYKGMNTHPGQTVHYQAVGYVQEEHTENIKLDNTVHYVIVDGLITDAYTRLTGLQNELQEQEKASKRTGVSLLSDKDKINDDGFVM